MNSEEEFYDAVTGFDSDNSSGDFSEANHKVAEMLDLDPHQSSRTGKHNGETEIQENGIKRHRTSLPAPMFSRSDFSVWSILKKCIGLELSKITMPIVFNEPLSFLQRITEYMEHIYLINKACSHADPLERMQAVAAFAVSAVASQWERTGKPFNPLLGETYELTRHNEAYTWTNPTCCVHNVIIGKLWLEQYGTVEIVNHSTGDKCVLNFKPCGLFGKELHRVEGHIQDKNRKKLCVIYGKWTECLWCTDPTTYETYKKNEKRGGEQKKLKPSEDVIKSENDEADDMPEVQDTVQFIPGSKLLWRINCRPPNSSQMYNFTSFAVSLNELEKGMEAILAPTDCRLRPDIRNMENGNMDVASKEKERLEEKQRAARKERAKDEVEWHTRWFHQGTNPYTGTSDWLYSGGYFDRNFSDCPDIY
ncbi:oxysterol-binding protein-related protein 2 isoform X3 [Egretta garzetta]|uniref:oxysterol-binding protein-related protein 2 isoform X3 n=1 Tax=Egretta garzetta TaxID=188379 RepID=UPI00163B7DC8|nr:oxysterol-binding protein-related protein 2 isoform X3 [Egretta garzetta]